MKSKNNKKTKIINAAVVSFLAISTVGFASEKLEKCYGISKAGMNDCATATASCAGSAKKDNQKDAFIFLPKGDCKKITGGSLKVITTSNKE